MSSLLSSAALSLSSLTYSTLYYFLKKPKSENTLEEAILYWKRYLLNKNIMIIKILKNAMKPPMRERPDHMDMGARS